MEIERPKEPPKESPPPLTQLQKDWISLIFIIALCVFAWYTTIGLVILGAIIIIWTSLAWKEEDDIKSGRKPPNWWHD